MSSTFPPGVYGITPALSHLYHRSPEPVQNAIIDAVRQYMTQFEQPATPEGKALAVHEAADELIAEHQADPGAKPEEIRCRAGCAYCCAMYVAVSPSEAALLLHEARVQGIPLDRARLARQAEAGVESWKHLNREDQACPFLGPDRQCRVYATRPLACRKHFVISEPDGCDMVRFPGGHVLGWYVPDAEVLTTALYTHEGADSMARQLLALLPKAGPI